MKNATLAGWLALGVAVLVLLPWSVQRAGAAWDSFRLLTQGTPAQAEVVSARSWFPESRPYRVEYRFVVAGATYEEPIYRATTRRVRDIGAPVSRSLWQRAAAADALGVLYLRDRPEVNMPLDGETWMVLNYVDQVARLLFAASMTVLLISAGTAQVAPGSAAAVRAVVAPFGCLVVGGVLGWVLLDVAFRAYHYAVGLEDMHGPDLFFGAVVVVANAALPVALVLGLLKLLRR